MTAFVPEGCDGIHLPGRLRYSHPWTWGPDLGLFPDRVGEGEWPGAASPGLRLAVSLWWTFVACPPSMIPASFSSLHARFSGSVWSWDGGPEARPIGTFWPLICSP